MGGLPGPAIGVDVGGTKLLAVRLDPGGQISGESLVASPLDGASLVRAVRSCVEEWGGAAPAAVGVGVPGLVDPSGLVRFAPNLQGVSGTPLTTALAAEFPRAAVWVGNDATAACWGEHQRGAAAGCDEVLMVTLGTGIGGGIISGGRLLEGAHHYAGEFGHMVVDPHGPLCPCGKRGCWERFASGSGLGAFGREAAVAGRAPRVVVLAGGDPENVRGEHVTRAAIEGDEAAVEIVSRLAWWLALGLASLANALDPELIVVGGGLVEAGELLMGPTRQAFAELVEAPEARTTTRIVPAALGARAGAIGAAILAVGAGRAG